MTQHTCHAIGCGRHTAPSYLMCKRHWRMVPQPIKGAVLARFRPGQHRLEVMPSPEWFDAARAAQVAVADAEGRDDVPAGYRLEPGVAVLLELVAA